MAIADLIEKTQSMFSNSEGGEEPDGVDVPDDASGLMEDVESDILEPDPKPVRKGAAKRRPAAPGKITAGQKRQLKDSLELMISLPAGAWAMRDPHCGVALLDSSEEIAARLVPLVMRSPTALQWFLGEGAGFMDWIGLAMALRPVVTTVWGHHVSKSVGLEEGEQGGDYSQFTAPTFG